MLEKERSGYIFEVTGLVASKAAMQDRDDVGRHKIDEKIRDAISAVVVALSQRLERFGEIGTFDTCTFSDRNSRRHVVFWQTVLKFVYSQF